MEITVTGYFRNLIVLFVSSVAILGGQTAFAQASPAESSTGFPPLDQWRSAVVAGDAAGLKAFYSTDPAAQVQANGVTSSADADVNFWLGLKARSMRSDERR